LEQLPPRPTREARFLRWAIISMGVGLLFLVSTVVLLAWNFLVAPVPPVLTYVAIALGFLSGTIILVSTLFLGLGGKSGARN